MDEKKNENEATQVYRREERLQLIKLIKATFMDERVMDKPKLGDGNAHP